MQQKILENFFMATEQYISRIISKAHAEHSKCEFVFGSHFPFVSKCETTVLFLEEYCNYSQNVVCAHKYAMQGVKKNTIKLKQQTTIP